MNHRPRPRFETTVAFVRNERGAVSTLMAFATLPLLLFAGAAIDFERQYSSKVALQTATDAALLASMPQVRNGATMASVQSAMQKFIYAATHDSTASLPVAPTKSADGTTVCAKAYATVSTTLMQVARISQVGVSATSCSKFNTDSYEIALVIDNSGSMADSAGNGQTKMQAVQTAAVNLVNTVAPPGSTPAHLPAFSVVPFTSAVNVGYNNALNSYYTGSLFVDYFGKSNIAFANFTLPPSKASTNPTSKFDLFSYMGSSWGGCVEERAAPYTISDDAATQATPNTLYVPYLWPDENDLNGSSVNNYLLDNGGQCGLGDAYATADMSAPGTGDGQSKVCKYHVSRINVVNSIFGSAFPAGPNLLCPSSAVIPLTTSASSTGPVQTAIQNMVANGDTNLISGVMWGWRTLSPNGPYNSGAASDVTGGQAAKSYTFVNTDGSPNHKVMILLTDGENHWSGQTANGGSTYGAPNKSTYSAFGYFWENRLGTTTAANAYSLMNTTTNSACTNAKAAGVEIYTIGFTATDGISAAGQAVLAACATDAAHNFTATDGASLQAVFSQIASQLSALRLTR